MSTEQNPAQPAQQPDLMADPFSIFDTKIEDIESFNEPESTMKVWDDIFYEPDPTKYPSKQYNAIIKLLPNVYDPKHPVEYLTTYKLPYPDASGKSFIFNSPTTVGGWDRCPAFLRWQANNDKSTASEQNKAIAKKIKRNNRGCVVIQIVQDAQRPELNGKLRLLRFTKGFELDTLIRNKISPSKEDVNIGVTPENVFDIFGSRLLYLKVTNDTNGRNFSASAWMDKDKSAGMAIIGADGNPLFLNASHKGNAEIQQQVIELLKAEHVNIKEHFAYKEPTPEQFARAERSLRVMFGEEAPSAAVAPASTPQNTPAPQNQFNNVQQPVQQTTPVQQQAAPIQPAPVQNTQPVQSSAPVQEQPVQQAAPPQQSAPVQQTVPEQGQQTAPPQQNAGDFLASLNLTN